MVSHLTALFFNKFSTLPEVIPICKFNDLPDGNVSQESPELDCNFVGPDGNPSLIGPPPS